MSIRGLSSRRLALLCAGFVPAIAIAGVGCAAPVESDGLGVDEPIGSAEQADVSFTAAPPLAHLDPTCTAAGGGLVAQNAGAPYHEAGTCASGDGMTFSDAVAACGSNVRYFGYYCADFAAAPPYQANDERSWTAYYGCCAATCSDGIQNQGEGGVDCGGPCGTACETCSDGIQNQGEDGVDCGGPCSPCAVGLAGDTNGIDACLGNFDQCTACFASDQCSGLIWGINPPYLDVPFMSTGNEFGVPVIGPEGIFADFSGPDGSILTVSRPATGSAGYAGFDWTFASLDYGTPITGIIPLGCTGAMPFVGSSFTATSINIRTGSYSGGPGLHACSFQITY